MDKPEQANEQRSELSPGVTAVGEGAALRSVLQHVEGKRTAALTLSKQSRFEMATVSLMEAGVWAEAAIIVRDHLDNLLATASPS